MFSSKLRSVAIFAICAGFVLSSAESAQQGGFRGVAWGASKSEVREREQYPLHHDIEGEIAYWNFQFAGVEAGLVYTFEDDRLVSARFMSRHRTNDPAEDLADYAAFQAALDEHFGDHATEDWVWADGEEHGAPAEPLAALTSGAAKKVSRWQLDGSKLTLLIAGSEGVVKTVRAVFEPSAP